MRAATRAATLLLTAFYVATIQYDVFAGAFIHPSCSPAAHAVGSLPTSSSWVRSTPNFAHGKNVDQEANFDEDDAPTGRRGFLSRAGKGTAGAAAAAAFAPTNGPIAPSAGGVANAAEVASAASSGNVISPLSPRVVLWGFGNQNKLMARYLHDKGIPVVGVVSHHDVGKDYGLLDYDPWPSIKKRTGVKIVDETSAPAMLSSARPNVCLMCTKSTLSDIMPALKTCATNGVNVITIAEELLFSGTSSPLLTQEADALFRQNGVSLTGSGFIDGACCEMAMALSGSMHRITGLEGTLRYDADANGPVLAAAHGIGLTVDEFETRIVRNEEQDKSYVYNSNEWFASALGLTLTSKGTTEVREPIVNDDAASSSSVPVYSKALGRTVPVGGVIGMRVVATTETAEGVTIRAEQIGSVYSLPSEKDFTEWKFSGEPREVKFSIEDPPTLEMTNTATIARIPQILDAPPGYVTTDSFEIARYKHWS